MIAPRGLPIGTAVDVVLAARAAGRAEERERCIWLLQRARIEALYDDDGVGAARLRSVEIYVEAGTQREDMATVPDP